MPPFLPAYGPTEGPLGFPMLDRQARQLDTLLKSMPKSNYHAYRKAVVAKAPTELNPGERSDVSWISTESVDRVQEVVVARGMNDSQFQANPLVTLQHAYNMPPVGRSLWRKRVKDGDLVGIKAKTQYPAKPDAWVEGDPWPPDKVLALVQAGLLNGKSIGFLPLKIHLADAKAREKHNFPADTLVIDEWLLLEYAVCFLPANQDALVESVSKGGLELPDDFLKAIGVDAGLLVKKQAPPAGPAVVPYTPLAEVERAVQQRMAGIDVEALARRAVEEAYGRARGRV
jgi:hypothetical protein